MQCSALAALPHADAGRGQKSVPLGGGGGLQEAGKKSQSFWGVFGCCGRYLKTQELLLLGFFFLLFKYTLSGQKSFYYKRTWGEYRLYICYLFVSKMTV